MSDKAKDPTDSEESNPNQSIHRRDQFNSLVEALDSDKKNGLIKSLGDYQRRFPDIPEMVRSEYRFWNEDLAPEETQVTGAIDRSEGQNHSQGMIGRRIGEYTLLEKLGHGAQGDVYLAQGEKLSRKVALKVLKDANTLKLAARLRFIREAETASKLNHSGLCTVHEFGEFKGVPFIVMEYVNGKSLLSLIKEAHSNGERSIVRSQLSSDEDDATSNSKSDFRQTSKSLRDNVTAIVEMIEKAARALHAAHEEHLVHRDIKPENIMMKDDGQPVILDFGLARDDESHELNMTNDGDGMGTPNYMPPEQTPGLKIRTDRRSDVYSLGVKRSSNA